MLILASSSRYRRQQLQSIKIPFEVIPADIDETPQPGEEHAAYVHRLAEEKARTIAKISPHAWVLGCDQAAYLPEIGFISKPETYENAQRMLQALSGKTLSFKNGVALWSPLEQRFYSAITEITVEMHALSEERIATYLAMEDALHCGGALRSEGLGIALCKAIHSNDPSALIGLPLITVLQLFEASGFPFWEQIQAQSLEAPAHL